MAIYMLSQHPDILHRLREEITTKVGTRRPSYDDIKEMKYLRAFINGEYVHELSTLHTELFTRGVAYVSRRVSKFYGVVQLFGC